VSDDRCGHLSCSEAGGTYRALMERTARVLRSYAEGARERQAFHSLWTGLVEDLDDWISRWPTQGFPELGQQPGRTADDAMQALERAVATAEALRSNVSSETQVLAVLDLKGTELDTLRQLRRMAPLCESRERTVLAQILRLAELLLRHSDKLHVHLKTLEVIQHLRVRRSATG
jgi:hypothetical protein